MDKRMAELVMFSQDFKLNKPQAIPEDLVPILAKEGKQLQQCPGIWEDYAASAIPS